MTPGGHFTQGTNCIPSEKSRSNRNALHVLLVGISAEMTADIIQLEHIFIRMYTFTCLSVSNYCITVDTDILKNLTIRNKPCFSLQWNRGGHTGSISPQHYKTYKMHIISVLIFQLGCLHKAEGDGEKHSGSRVLPHTRVHSEGLCVIDDVPNPTSTDSSPAHFSKVNKPAFPSLYTYIGFLPKKK